MKTCPFCGAQTKTLLRVKDGPGTRIGCPSCKDEEPDDGAPREPQGQGSDFLREVMRYQGTGDFH